MFFSVKHTMLINGKRYTPCICYKADEMIINTIKNLENEGKVTLHKEEVFFQNGKILSSVKEREQHKNKLLEEERKIARELKKAEKNSKKLKETEGF